MKFYDAHIHFIPQGSSDDIRRSFDFLEGIGLVGFDALVLSEYPRDTATILKMIPAGYHNQINPHTFNKQRNFFTLLKQSCNLKIIPYLDARFIEDDIEQKIIMYRDLGVKGLKLLYVPEEDEGLKVGGMQQAFGRTVKESERITALLIDSASSQGMTVLFHVDLRKYGEFVAEMLAGYPRTNFNIPHFGFSRKSVSDLLDTYPNCYTDISSLTPFIKNCAPSYLDFIKRHQNRILFGSDAMILEPVTVQSTMQVVVDFLEGSKAVKKVLSENYLAFHKYKENT